MAVDFVDFHRHERAGDEYGDPFAPALRDPKASALGQKQSRIDKAADAEKLDFMRSEIRGLFDQAVDEVVTGVEAKHFNSIIRFDGHVLVEQLKAPTPTETRKITLANLNKAIRRSMLRSEGFMRGRGQVAVLRVGILA